MNKKKMLLVTAKYGPLEFSETASPYDENAHDEQVETCLESIVRQIDDAGKTEMLDAFQVQKTQIIAENDERA